MAINRHRGSGTTAPGPAPFSLRDGLADDLAGISEIERLCFPQPWSLETFRRELSLPFSRLIVAVDPAGGLLGFLCRWLVADECHILNVAVHPRARRLGVATAMLDAVTSEAKNKRIGVVALEVRRSNVGARTLYRKLRFQERRLRANYYGPGEDAVVMELTFSDDQL